MMKSQYEKMSSEDKGLAELAVENWAYATKCHEIILENLRLQKIHQGLYHQIMTRLEAKYKNY